MTIPDHETIEKAYKVVSDVIGTIPEESTLTKRAKEHLKISQDYTYQARERSREFLPEEGD